MSADISSLVLSFIFDETLLNSPEVGEFGEDQTWVLDRSMDVRRTTTKF